MPKLKLLSAKRAAKAMEQALLYYDRGVILVNKPTDMVCQMSYGTSAKVSYYSGTLGLATNFIAVREVQCPPER